MTETNLIDRTAQHVRTVLSGDGSGHDWWHVYRVWRMAKRIGQRLGIRDTREISVLADGAAWIWEEVLRAFPRSHGRIGRLPCTGSHRRCGQDRLRRRNGSLPAMDRVRPQCPTFQRLAGGTATLASGMATNEETIASETAPVVVALLGQTPLASWLCSAAGRGPIHRQWPSRGGVQAHDRSKAETNRSPMEGSPGQPDGKSMCPNV